MFERHDAEPESPKANLQGKSYLQFEEPLSQHEFEVLQAELQSMAYEGIKALHLFHKMKNETDASACLLWLANLIGRLHIDRHPSDMERILEIPEFYNSFKFLVEGIRAEGVVEFFAEHAKEGYTPFGKETDMAMAQDGLLQADIYLSSSGLNKAAT